MTTPQEPGERPRPTIDGPRPTLDRPPGDRYLATRPPGRAEGGVLDAAARPLAATAGGVLAFVVLGGVLGFTAGLIILAGLLGWLMGLLVRPPIRAAAAAVGAVIVGLLGIWLFGRLEGGVLDPIAYFAEVQGLVLPLELLAAGGMAAAASQ